MARVTVEDCLKQVENRFQLVLIASKRARQLAMGKDPYLPWDNDKPTVLALREIAEGYIGPSILTEVAEPEQELVETEVDTGVEAGIDRGTETTVDTGIEASINADASAEEAGSAGAGESAPEGGVQETP